MKFRLGFLLCSLLAITSGSKRDLMRLMSDFLPKFNQPTQITTFTCWKHSECMALSKTFSKFYVQQVNNYDNATRIPYNVPEEFQIYLLDLNCANYEHILKQANDVRLFSSERKWIIISNNNTNDTDVEITGQNLSILLDSHFYIISKNHGNYRIKSVYKLRKSRKEFFENDVALWSKNDGFLYYNRLVPSINRTDLQGTTLNVSFVATTLATLHHLRDYRDIQTDPIPKISYLLTRLFLSTVNATSRFKLRKYWGYLNASTGLYSGMIGDLQQGRADIGTAAYFTRDRIPIVEYIAPTAKSFTRFIFRSLPLSYVKNVFTLPFDARVWFSCLLLVALASGILLVISRWEWRIGNTTVKPTFADVLLLEVGAICQQGAEAEPRTPSGRIAALFVFIAFMFIYTSYSANIVALLQSTTDSIRTIDELASSRIKLGAHDTTYSRYYFQTETEPSRRRLYSKMSLKGEATSFMPKDVGLKRMREEFFAFHVESATAYRYMSETFLEHEKCGIGEIDVWNVLEPYHTMQKNSSYKELVKIIYRKFHENGVQSREVRLIFTKKPVCQQSGGNFMSVGLIDSYYAFLIIVLGGALSLLTLVAEIVYCRLSESKARRNRQFLH